MAKENKPLMIFLAGEIKSAERIKAMIEKREFDFYAADGGYLLANQMKINLKCILGDFDSAKRPSFSQVLTYPCEKDETDAELALKHALNEGYSEIWMIAPFGGRLDHTIANLGLLDYGQAAKIYLYDGSNLAFLLNEGIHSLENRFRYISFFAYQQSALVSLKGFKYELEKYSLELGAPIGISNEPKMYPEVCIHQGKLLCICIEKETMEEL